MMGKGSTGSGLTLAKNSTIVGFALFAMFFGAGNLIFPPTLGQESGDLWMWGFIGFVMVDAVLSCLGVFVVNSVGGPRHAFDHALGKVGSAILNTAAMLCLCVIFAMPRTAATTFELSVAPYIGEGANSYLAAFSVVFFVVVYLLACRKSRVVDIIGKFFTPTLMVGVVVLIVVGIVHPLGPIELPHIGNVFEEGVRAGYQTMDVLGVAAFSIIILDSAIVKRYPEGRERLTLLARASIGAVLMLGIVYGGLTYLGATSSALGSSMSQVDLLVAIVQALLGEPGLILLSAVVMLACATTAVALVSSAADFFSEMLGGKISYNTLLIADCIIGAIICDVGLDNIIQFADPVLGVIYPPFIVVVIMLLFHRHIRSRAIYQGAALGAFLGGLALELYSDGIFEVIPLDWLPLYPVGFGWVLLAVAGALFGWIAVLIRQRRIEHRNANEDSERTGDCMSKKVAVMLGEGFEPIEAIAPVDCMRRAGIEVELVSVMPSVQVKSAQGIVVEAEALDENMDLSTFDAIVIPGGGLGVDNLKKSDKLSKALVESMAVGRHVAAICAGPTVLNELGLLEGRKVTCYPGCEEGFPQGVYLPGQSVVVDENLITASGPGQALEFGIAIVRALCGDDVADQVASSMLVR